MNLQSQSWEYASEMVLKSVRMELRTAEVPVRFLKDQEGRMSHHKRAGWFAPWKAAWINLRAMFVYGADFFVLKPGIVLLALGLLITLPLSFGPITIGPVTFSLYWMLAGLDAHRRRAPVLVLRLHRPGALRLHGRATAGVGSPCFPYTRTVAVSAFAFLLGVALTVPLVVDYVQLGALAARRARSGAPPGRDRAARDDRRLHDLRVHARSCTRRRSASGSRRDV